MLRAPTWKMSAYCSISSIWLRSITSVTSTRFSARAASRSIRRPSSPRPWNVYGELRGLNAPPRNTFAPARRTAAAAARTCGSLSAEHGPAITITSSPPMRTSPTVITVGSGLNVRLASLYGEVIRSTSWTPSSISISPASGCPLPTAPSTVLVTPVDRWTSIPISTRRFTTCSICASLARSSITTTIAALPVWALGVITNHPNPQSPNPQSPIPNPQSLIPNPQSLIPRRRRRNGGAVSVAVVAVNHAPLEPARLVDDAFEQPRDRVGPERPFRRDAAHVCEHLLLALGLIHLDAEILLDAADLARHARALVEQPHQHFVHAIDVVAELVEPAHRYTRTGRPSARSAASVRPAPFSQRTYSSTRGIKCADPLSVAITDTSALPTTAASAKPPISATCSGRETPKPSAIGSDVCARMRRAIASAPDATRSRAPVTPSREMP